MSDKTLLTLWKLFHPAGIVVAMTTMAYLELRDWSLVQRCLLAILAVVVVRFILFLVTGGSKWA